ncbi:ribokinase [Terriglobus roseus DSM 18391]|uniref:Ribokinase n=1 Tax=Terriglobus roseus (strain DSM 18391 / NRRL B-41598 / KBS 63) TaxID=926566 RepID=I3ZMQ3_TERRK|nr:ribokinase [Terriglobus roseus]AFL90521.1 ribokinase [Terriglobus roseus DSM 18391]
MRTIVVVGSLNMDMVSTVDRMPAPGETVAGRGFAMVHGGKGANQAVAAARLGAVVRMVGCVGSDSFGGLLRQGLVAEGIDVAGVRECPGASGVAAITVDGSGGNSIVVYAGANALLLPGMIDAASIDSAAMVLVQLETPMATVVRLAEVCSAAGTPLMLDPAPAQALSVSLLRKTAWLTPNESEARTLLGVAEDLPMEEAAERLLALGVRNVMLKLGARGVYLAGADVASTLVPAPAVRAVDTTAAGDCFNAAFAVALTEGQAPVAAARFACAAAALSTTGAGAQPSMPTREAVLRMMRG